MQLLRENILDLSATWWLPCRGRRGERRVLPRGNVGLLLAALSLSRVCCFVLGEQWAAKDNSDIAIREGDHQMLTFRFQLWL